LFVVCLFLLLVVSLLLFILSFHQLLQSHFNLSNMAFGWGIYLRRHSGGEIVCQESPMRHRALGRLQIEGQLLLGTVAEIKPRDCRPNTSRRQRRW
jgi:hypothetical protein